MKFYQKKSFKIIISTLLFAILISQINFQEFNNLIQKVNLIQLLTILLGISFIVTVIKIIRWKILLNISGEKAGLKLLTKSTIASIPFAVMTPARIGELTNALFLEKKVKKTNSIITLLIAKGADMIIQVLLAVIFYFLLLQKILPPGYGNFILILLIGTIISGIFLLNKKLLKKVIRKPLKKVLNKILKRKVNLKKNYNKITNIIFNKKMLIVLLLTVISWILHFYLIKILFSLLGENVPLTYIIALMPIASLTSMIPISLAGLGIREATAVYLFSLIGIKPEITFTTQIALLLKTFTFSIIGLITYLRIKK